MTRLAKIPVRYQPGSQWIYSLAPDVEARLVEVLSQMPFEEFLKQRLFKPLAMSDTHFWLTKEQYERLSAVHWSKDGVLVPWDDAHGHPGDSGHQAGNSASNAEPWASINKEGANHARIRGSYGLISTAEDYWRFAQMIDNGGELNGIRLLSPETVRYMTRDHVGSIDSTVLSQIQPGAGFGLGFGVIQDPVAAGFLNSEGSIWWDGAATTLWWADPQEDLVVVAMTQYLDQEGASLLQQLRPQLRAWIYGALLN
jgi:CubicO group peptidase (beta-lactamase class C family)